MATDPLALWAAVARAGSVRAYVDQQLKEKGFLIERRPVDDMSDAEKARYKKTLKDEAAERRRLNKEAWAAYKANHIVHVGEEVYFSDANDNDHWDHPRAEERLAENALPKLDSPQELARALGITIPELRWLAYHRTATTTLHYTRFTIPKASGGERAIWAPRPKLKQAQRWILREIAEKLPVHGAAHGFVAGRSTATHAAVHTGAEIVVRIDIADFFPTVNLRRVKGIFRKAGYREQVSTLLALLCTEAPREIVEHEGKTMFVALGPRCLPQGAPTSPALTNTLSMRIDRRLQGLARKLGWRYSRYADDLTFSLPLGHKGPPRLGTLMGGVHEIVHDEGFAIRPDKTRVYRTGSRQAVTGLIVNGEGQPRAPRELRRRLRAAVHHLQSGKPLPEGESLERLKGQAAYVNMTDPELGRKLLDQLAAFAP